MGCGTGQDITWWATLETRDDPPAPYNYNCFAVDKDASKLNLIPDLANIRKINKNFNDYPLFPVSIDLMFAHDSLQYSHNPLETLKLWNQSMTVNGMLLLSIPQSNGVEYNRYFARTYDHCYYNFTPGNLIYMLAVNGFDCKDAYLLKRFNDPWINLAVYKSDIEPMDPATTGLFDLIDTGLLNQTVVDSIFRNGFIKQEDIIYPWLDKENYYIDWTSEYTQIPETAVETTVVNSTNDQIIETSGVLQQADAVKISTPNLKPVGILRPHKGRYVK